MLYFECVCETCDNDSEIGVVDTSNQPEVCPLCGSADISVKPLEDED